MRKKKDHAVVEYENREYRVWPNGRVAVWVPTQPGKQRHSRSINALGPTAKIVRELARLAGHDIVEPTKAILGGLII